MGREVEELDLDFVRADGDALDDGLDHPVLVFNCEF